MTRIPDAPRNLPPDFPVDVPGAVWVLHIWSGITPERAQIDPDDPYKTAGCLLGIFETRAVALAELADETEFEHKAWWRPGGSPNYWELRAASPTREWYSLERYRVRSTPTHGAYLGDADGGNGDDR